MLFVPELEFMSKNKNIKQGKVKGKAVKGNGGAAGENGSAVRELEVVPWEDEELGQGLESEPEKKKNVGPSKFTPEMERMATKLAAKGIPDHEIADRLDITRQTLANWKVAHPGLFNKLNELKELHDRSVERSLYERATGFSSLEDKVMMVKGKPTVVTVNKYYPPDPTSMIFWLKNRQPRKWRERIELDHGMKLKLVKFDR